MKLSKGKQVVKVKNNQSIHQGQAVNYSNSFNFIQFMARMLGVLAISLISLKSSSKDKLDLAYEYLFQNNFDSALLYSIKYKEHCLSKQDSSCLIRYNILCGKIYFNQSDFTQALIHYKNAISIGQKINNEFLIPYAQNGLAIVLKNVGQYQESINNYLKASDGFVRNNDTKAVASNLNAIGLLHNRLKNYKEAADAFKKSQLLFSKSLDTNQVSRIYNNLGLLKKEIHQFDSSAYYFHLALKTSKEINNRRKASIYSLNLGDLYLQIGQLDSSEYYSKIAYHLKDSLNDRKGLAIVSNNLGNLYMAGKEWEKVPFYLKQAEQLATEIGELETLKENYRLWSDYYENRNKPELALDYHKRLLTIKDSLLSQEKIRAISELQIQFETEQKEQEIVFLNQQKQTQNALIDQQNMFIWLLAISSILFLALGAWAYKSYKAKQKAHGKIELLLRELHHRVKNNLQMISSILSLQSEKLSDQKAKAAIKESEMRVNAMNLLHQRLYMNGTGSEIEIREYLNDLITDLRMSYSASNQNVTLESSIDSVQVDVEKAIPFGLITSELVSNAYKHAFNESEKGKICVSLKEKGKKLRLEISDDGKGFETSNQNTEYSFGLRMVDILCQQLRANKYFSNGKGSRFEFEVDLKS